MQPCHTRASAVAAGPRHVQAAPLASHSHLSASASRMRLSRTASSAAASAPSPRCSGSVMTGVLMDAAAVCGAGASGGCCKGIRQRGAGTAQCGCGWQARSQAPVSQAPPQPAAGGGLPSCLANQQALLWQLVPARGQCRTVRIPRTQQLSRLQLHTATNQVGAGEEDRRTMRISRRRGMPSVTLASPRPAMWNVLSVICPGGG